MNNIDAGIKDRKQPLAQLQVTPHVTQSVDSGTAEQDFPRRADEHRKTLNGTIEALHKSSALANAPYVPPINPNSRQQSRIKRVACFFLGHHYRLVEVFSPDTKRACCKRCGADVAIDHRTGMIAPWSESFDRDFRENGYLLDDPYNG